MIRVRLVGAAIDVGELVRVVSSTGCGATTVFLGMVRDENDGRDVQGIEYSAYDAMAEAEMRRIVDEAVERFAVDRVAMDHRIGSLGLGDVSVAIAISHPHRQPALDAQRYIIEELKRRVPIWKKELYVDGSREWVDPTNRRTGAAL